MTLLVNGSDVTSLLLSGPALAIERRMNAPSRCTFALMESDGAGAQFNDFVQVNADNGVVLFTGYIATNPFSLLAGDSVTGPAYALRVQCVSEEYVLDCQALPAIPGSVDEGAGDMLAAITSRLDARGLNTTALNGGPSLAVYRPAAGRQWSTHAAELSTLSRQSYRALSGAVSMVPAGSVVHTLGTGAVTLKGLSCETSRPLANDVTLTGEDEPDVYVMELFEGDGATKEFDLSRSPMHLPNATIVDEGFTESAINLQQWDVADPGSHFSLGGAGLAISGGTGADGQTVLSAIDPVELGGAIVFEAGNVSFAAGSDGQLCGFYAGQPVLAGCVAGFRVRSSEGALLLAPVVDGAEVATPYTLTPDHAYTLRIRLHVPEVVRALASFYSAGASGITQRGGGLVASSAWIEFELQDSASPVNAPATVLYDGQLSVVPASATFVAVDSLDLNGSIGYITVTRPGTVRVTTIPPGGTESTCRIGIAASGAECHVSGEKLYFYTAYTPAAGTLIKVRYRTQRRSVARLASPTSASGTTGDTGVPAESQWAGSVGAKAARCSADCEAAAQAVLDFSTNAAAAWSGTLSAPNLQDLSTGDVWPGDVISLEAPLVNASDTTQPSSLLVRAATITRVAAATEFFQYSLQLANDWSDSFSVRVENTVAADALLPQQAQTAPDQAAANIPTADVSSATTTAITLVMNQTAPTGGGFEVRRQDAGFGNGLDSGISPQGLVVRSPVATFTLPRSADHEELYVRMYDGSTPPLYSRSSAAIITNLPT